MIYASIGGLQIGDMFFALVSFVTFVAVIAFIILLIFRTIKSGKKLERIEEKLDRLLEEKNNPSWWLPPKVRVLL
ncbi:DUF4083 domain-containing protein [Gracilibacillus salitolerans]|uniref:DUF4083 domain-containing protein n=1 Tax=Gracilibacillus salitolerans TaxID=2663022 RepID=A0A5Q2TUD0_9BACI|nr:DUF4083 domain-containing protein [Gracilibacillus salitolerans]QGH36388.1 DUF4083 domain-containing protein [Gracilibacillus salitolerans]